MFLELNKASIKRGDKLLLDNVSLTIPIGQHVAILGQNGAGKSTLIKLLSGDIYPLHRKEPPIKVFGEAHWSLFELRHKLAVVSAALQESYQKHAGCTAAEVILSGLYGSVGIYADRQPQKKDLDKVKEVIKRLGLAKLSERKVGAMSSGELRRCLIGRALINDPQIIVLDEPTVSLDIKARTLFLADIRRLAQLGHTVIMVTHLIEEIIPEIERVIVLKEGRIFADDQKENILSAKTLSQAFDLLLKVESHQGYFTAIPR